MDKNLRIDDKILVSIIIPIFNVESFLERCLDSIFSQTVDFPFEVIAVNDASTDKSLFILENYKSRFPQIQIINHEKNKKLSRARLSGILVAKGTYIIHVDSDDWILPDTLNTICSILNENSECEVFVFNYMIQQKDNSILLKKYIKNEDCVYPTPSIQNLFLGSCWNKIVKKDILIDIIYGKKPINSEEDLVYAVEVLFRSAKVKLVPFFYYVYCRNQNSLTNSSNLINYIQNKINVLESINDVFLKYKNNSLDILSIYKYAGKGIYLFIFRNHLERKISSEELTVFLKYIHEKKLLPEFLLKKLLFSKKSFLYSFIIVMHEFTLITPFFYIRDNFFKKNY